MNWGTGFMRTCGDMQCRQRNWFFTTMILAVADEQRYKVLILDLKCPMQVNQNHWIGGTVWVPGNCAVLSCSYCLVSTFLIIFCWSCVGADSYRYVRWTIITISIYLIFADGIWLAISPATSGKIVWRKVFMSLQLPVYLLMALIAPLHRV